MRRIFTYTFALCLMIFALFLPGAVSEYYAPSSITLVCGQTRLEPTETLKLTAVVYPEGAKQSVKWESLDSSIASIDQNGLVTGKKPGSVYIRAYSRDNSKVYGQIKLQIKYNPAPDTVSLPFSSATLKTGETLSLAPVIAPDNASDVFVYASSNPSVASVSNQGLITALSFGECTVTVKSAANTKISASIALEITDARVPDLIAAYPSYLNLEPGLKYHLSVLTLPEALNAELVWKTSNPDIVTIDKDGVVTALREGSAYVSVASAYAENVNYVVSVQAAYGRDIQKIVLPEDEISLLKGDRIPLNMTVSPENASRAIVYEFSNPAVASVDENGMLTALRYGETTLTVYYHKNKKVFDCMTITVSDPKHPLKMESSSGSKIYLSPSETAVSLFTFTPETADTKVNLTSSNEAIVRISEDGSIIAVSPGVCTVQAKSAYNPALSLTLTVTVNGEDYTLRMPERRTDISGIEDNRAKINAVRDSAKTMLAKEFNAGVIGKQEYERRLEIIDAAFHMYDFPWMVTRLEKYWMAANSEDGAKDFKPGIVYYGLPYTSGVNSSRNYNVTRALEDKWYVPSGDGNYYIFNYKNEFYDGRYAGNDCSAFVAFALFNSAYYRGQIVKTGTLYSDDRLVTTDNAPALLAGDILVRHSKHVLMFLYWADDAHTQAVFIEQGGDEPAINTISTSVYTVSDYTEDYYHIRVLRSFD